MTAKFIYAAALFALLAGCNTGLASEPSSFDKIENEIKSNKIEIEKAKSLAHRELSSSQDYTNGATTTIVSYPVKAVASYYSLRTIGHCGLIRFTCVVDGDTLWLNGSKIRVADIDTPEISKPQCSEEKALGDRATDRLIQLLNRGPFEILPIGNRDADRYGRKLRVIQRNGRSLGDQLVAEGLARTWTGRREPWC